MAQIGGESGLERPVRTLISLDESSLGLLFGALDGRVSYSSRDQMQRGVVDSLHGHVAKDDAELLFQFLLNLVNVTGKDEDTYRDSFAERLSASFSTPLNEDELRVLRQRFNSAVLLFELRRATEAFELQRAHAHVLTAARLLTSFRTIVPAAESHDQITMVPFHTLELLYENSGDDDDVRSFEVALDSEDVHLLLKRLTDLVEEQARVEESFTSRGLRVWDTIERVDENA